MELKPASAPKLVPTAGAAKERLECCTSDEEFTTDSAEALAGVNRLSLILAAMRVLSCTSLLESVISIVP